MRILLVEDDETLSVQMADSLTNAGYAVDCSGDGEDGHFLGETEPYDAIIVAAAAPKVPESLINQLKEGGRIVIPVGDPFLQKCVRAKKEGGRVRFEDLGTCSFVPLVGEEGWKREPRAD